MSEFASFRKKMDSETQCKLKFEQHFLLEGAGATEIQIPRLNETRKAYIVLSSAEGPDSAVIFTPKQTTKANNLLKADYYLWEDRMYFVYEDVVLTYDASYIKQKSYQCNVTFTHNEQQYGGYFMSSLRRYVDTDFQKDMNITDTDKPLLIIPNIGDIKVGTKLSIGNKPWQVIDIDHITNAGILYISLDRDFYTKSDDIIVNYSDYVLKAGIEHSFNTSDAYFNTSTPLQIKSRTANKIIAIVPYGITEVDISTKINGNIQTQKYKVEV